MTPAEYRDALATLGLSQQAAGRWLMVSPKTAQNYAKLGPSGPAAVAIRMALKHGVEDMDSKALAELEEIKAHYGYKTNAEALDHAIYALHTLNFGPS